MKLKRSHLYFVFAGIVCGVWALMNVVSLLRKQEVEPIVNSIMLALISAMFGRGQADKYMKENENEPPDSE